MNYVILEKAKPYTRTRRGRFERVRGYTGKPRKGVSRKEFLKILDRWQRDEDRSAFKKLVELYKKGDPTAISLSRVSKRGMQPEVTLYRYASLPNRVRKKLEVGQRLKLKSKSWSTNVEAAEDVGAITGIGAKPVLIKVKVPKELVIYRLNQIKRSGKFSGESEHICDRMRIRILQEDPRALHTGKMNFVDAQLIKPGEKLEKLSPVLNSKQENVLEDLKFGFDTDFMSKKVLRSLAQLIPHPKIGTRVEKKLLKLKEQYRW